MAEEAGRSTMARMSAETGPASGFSDCSSESEGPWAAALVQMRVRPKPSL